MERMCGARGMGFDGAAVTKACCGAGGGADVRRGGDGGVREAGGTHQLGRRPPDAARVQRPD
ncbi:hypothetical protein ABZP36_022585 [Zizania latifolia]